MLNGAKIDIKISKSDFSTIPSDKYQVQLTDVNLKTKVFNGVEENGLNWEMTILDNKTMEVDGQPESLRGRKLWFWTSAKLSPRSNLGKMLNAIYKKEISEVEQEDFQPEDVIDRQLCVFVEVNQGKGQNADREFSNVVSTMKADKDMSPFENDKSAKGEAKESKPVIEELSEEEAKGLPF